MADDLADWRTALHELKQPLNVIRLAGGNIRSRIGQRLDPADAAYLSDKLDRMEQQTERAATIIEGLLAGKGPD